MLADTGVAFQGLLHAVQQYFQRLDVKLLSQISDDEDDIDDAQIMLIQASMFPDIERMVRAARDRFPNIPIGLMVEGDWRQLPGLDGLIQERMVQGLLPSSMQMSVWLATVWLLLNGGEYFPSAAIERLGQASPSGATHRPPPEATPRQRLADRLLSNRENQVLELMSEGLQNKLIAARMELSEHTVKVHVHNIIRKLRVHNRTQAAAIFHAAEKSQGRAHLAFGEPSRARPLAGPDGY